jgi:hypothetical protein
LLITQLHLILSLVSSAYAVPPVSTTSMDGHTFSYYSNSDLTTPNPNIDHAIIVIHGSDRNADTYYRTMDVVTGQANVAASTVIISPFYKEAGDPVLAPDELLFTDEGWLRGDAATNDADFGSFDVMDQFLTTLTNKTIFPNLKFITITGHSAGGQFTQRFSLGTQVEYSAPDVHFRYLPVNPGSYMYLNEDRPNAPTAGCAFNDYKYGLNNLNAYQSRVAVQTSLQNYLKRDIVYFLGEADQLTDELDDGCEAQAQGNFRFERGMNFKKFLDTDFPTQTHHLFTAPGIGHTEWGMYTSPNGLHILFTDSL